MRYLALTLQGIHIIERRLKIASFIKFHLEYKSPFDKLICVEYTFSKSMERCNLRSSSCAVKVIHKLFFRHHK